MLRLPNNTWYSSADGPMRGNPLSSDPHLGGSVALSAEPSLRLVGFHEEQPETTIPMLLLAGAVAYGVYRASQAGYRSQK